MRSAALYNLFALSQSLLASNSNLRKTEIGKELKNENKSFVSYWLKYLHKVLKVIQSVCFFHYENYIRLLFKLLNKIIRYFNYNLQISNIKNLSGVKKYFKQLFLEKGNS